MRRNAYLVSLATCFVIVLSTSVALAKENWIDTWKLNTAKSKYRPGPGPKNLTLNWESTADGIKFTSDGVNGEGNPMNAGYVSRFDGADVPYSGNPDADTASAKKIDDNRFQNVWKMGGKPTITTKAVVSKDGKTLTITLTGKNAKGQAVKNVTVYDRQ